MAGTPLEVLQKLGGWARYEMVLRYAHLSSGYIHQYADNIEL
jgi:beta-glucosidase/6-phospho-beta-glucosidase/beta-galactosidase